MTSEETARLFHETYERLAPQHGYQTRKASAVPWGQVPERNRALMIAVAAQVAPLIAAEAVAAERERCAQLAEQHGATYASYGTDLDPVRIRKPFAVLLREEP